MIRRQRQCRPLPPSASPSKGSMLGRICCWRCPSSHLRPLRLKPRVSGIRHVIYLPADAKISPQRLEPEFPVSLNVWLNRRGGSSQEFRSLRFYVPNHFSEKSLSDLRWGGRASNAKISYHEPLVSGKTCRSDQSDRYSLLFGDKASVRVESS